MERAAASKEKGIPTIPQLIGGEWQPAAETADVRDPYRGTVVAQTHNGNQVADVAVILAQENRRDPESIGDLLLSNGNGDRVPLSQLADIFQSSGRFSILHEGDLAGTHGAGVERDMLAFDAHRLLRRQLDGVLGSGNLAACILDGLAGLAREELGEARDFRFDQSDCTTQQRGTLITGHRTHLLARSKRGPYRGFDIRRR